MPKMATSKSTKKIDPQKACRLIYKEKTRDLLRSLMRTTIGDKSTEGIVTKFTKETLRKQLEYSLFDVH